MPSEKQDPPSTRQGRRKKTGVVEEAPLHLGHRERLRRRILTSGADTLQAYEVLEHLLFYCYPRIDTKDIAKRLIAEFGSLEEVLCADADDLVTRGHLRETGVAMIKTVQAAALALARKGVREGVELSSFDAVLDYLHARFAHEKTEHLYVLYLDRRNRLLRDEVQGEGTVDQAPVYPREIVRRAVQLNATAILLVHNHPSGDPTPSRADIAITKEIGAAARKLDIILHDHIIIGRHGHTSLKSEGLI